MSPLAHPCDLEYLSVELLIHILGFLSGRDVALCARVSSMTTLICRRTHIFLEISRSFHGIIQSSVHLQYNLECYLAGVADGFSKLSVGERLNNLREWRAARRRFQWTSHTRNTLSWFESYGPSGTHYDLVSFGSVYCERLHRTITIVQPPSKYAGREARQWVLEDVGFIPWRWTYDHSQRLLVLVEYPYVIITRLRSNGLTHNNGVAPIRQPAFAFTSYHRKQEDLIRRLRNQL